MHLSNIFRRDEFRHHSYVSLAAKGVICGLGAKGYELAIEAMADIVTAEAVAKGGKRRPEKPKRPDKKGQAKHDGEGQGETPAPSSS